MKEPILKVNDLTIRYKDAEEPVIKNLSFTLHQGEILCISGKSGAGKSCLSEKMELETDCAGSTSIHVGIQSSFYHWRNNDGNDGYL